VQARLYGPFNVAGLPALVDDCDLGYPLLAADSFLAIAFLKAVARDVRQHRVTDLENGWSVLMRTVGKGHDKTY
jgi:hypothetical protein